MSATALQEAMVTAAGGAGAHQAQHHYALGRSHKAGNDFAAAEQAYRQALQLRPDYLDAWISLGILLRIQGRLAEAEACQREAVRLDPANFLAVLNLGTVLFTQDRNEAAADCFRQALGCNPHSAEAHNNLGRALLRLKDVTAAQHFAAALKIDSNYFDAAEGLGICWFQAGSFDRAADALFHASRIRPQSMGIRLFLARTYVLARNFAAAEAEYEQVLREHPDLPEAQCGLAVLLAAKGENDRPRRLFEAGLDKRPDDAYMQFQYATWLLRNGAFDKAWKYYESRWRQAHAGWVDAIDRSLPAPRWQGEPLAGKTLLVTCEQGLGDEIMFASVLQEIVGDAAHCIVECDARLAALLRRSFARATVFAVDRGDRKWSRHLENNLHRLPHFDYWSPAGSLPGYRRMSAQDFPKHQGYLIADAQRAQYWRTRLGELGEGLKVGISWRGGVPISNAAGRSMTLEQLRPILDTAGVHFINLQYHAGAPEELDSFTASSGIPIHHWQDAIDDYDATAALVDSLDLVISVCTSIVHLCGALGRPVWVMAPLVAEWRYGRQGPSMIWYPSVRMFRQPRLDDWNPVIADVQRALHDYRGRLT